MRLSRANPATFFIGRRPANARASGENLAEAAVIGFAAGAHARDREGGAAAWPPQRSNTSSRT